MNHFSLGVKILFLEKEKIIIIFWVLFYHHFLELKTTECYFFMCQLTLRS